MKTLHILLATAALSLAVAFAGCAQIQSALANPANATEVAAVKAQAQSLLTTFVFTAAADKLAGANWADSGAAAIYAAQESLAENPVALNALLGNYLPADSAWTPVIDGLAAKLITGKLNTQAGRSAALSAIAEVFNAQAAAARAK